MNAIYEHLFGVFRADCHYNSIKTIYEPLKCVNFIRFDHVIVYKIINKVDIKCNNSK